MYILQHNFKNKSYRKLYKNINKIHVYFYIDYFEIE